MNAFFEYRQRIDDIIAKAKPVTGQPDSPQKGFAIEDLEVIAAMIDGSISINDVSDELLDRWEKVIGMRTVAEIFAG